MTRRELHDQQHQLLDLPKLEGGDLIEGMLEGSILAGDFAELLDQLVEKAEANGEEPDLSAPELVKEAEGKSDDHIEWPDNQNEPAFDPNGGRIDPQDLLPGKSVEEAFALLEDFLARMTLRPWRLSKPSASRTYGIETIAEVEARQTENLLAMAVKENAARIALVLCSCLLTTSASTSPASCNALWPLRLSVAVGCW